MEVFRTPDSRFQGLAGYAFEPHYVEIDGLRLHYIDEGAGDPFVCFHGEPSWSYEYRNLIPALVAAGKRVICPDYAGFGRSDKPIDRDWYTYDRHCDLMARLLEGLDLAGVTVVVHDWGGPIGLRWAVEHTSQVDRLVIMNTAPFVGIVSPGWQQWYDWVTDEADLPIDRVLHKYTVTDVPAEVIAGFEAPFPSPESKAGAMQFPLLVPRDVDQPMAVTMQAVVQELGRFQGPALVIFSDSDPIFPHPPLGDVLSGLIPNARELVTLEGVHHFVLEDAGDRVISEIVAFAGS